MSAARHLLIALSCALTALLAGCASIGAPLPPSLELIKPPTDLRAIRKGDHVYLSWTIPPFTLEHQTVRHRGPTLICRSVEVVMAECGTPAGSVLPPSVPTSGAPTSTREQATFVDQLPASFVDARQRDWQKLDATSTVTYAVEALNTSSRASGLSNQVQISLAPTISPPSDFHAELTPEGVRLTWTGELLSLPASSVNYSYRAYRRLAGTQERTIVGQVARGFDAHPSILDQTFAWEQHYEYWLDVVTDVRNASHPCPEAAIESSACVDHIEIEGDDTPFQPVFTHDVYPPAVPSGLQAVFSGPGQKTFIDLIWAPDTDSDLAGYNIYRHESGGQPVKINPSLVKTPSFRDAEIVSGKIYNYAVSAVDLRGNESAPSTEASEQVP
jgi:hypothetical protein